MLGKGNWADNGYLKITHLKASEKLPSRRLVTEANSWEWWSDLTGCWLMMRKRGSFYMLKIETIRGGFHLDVTDDLCSMLLPLPLAFIFKLHNTRHTQGRFIFPYLCLFANSVTQPPGPRWLIMWWKQGLSAKFSKQCYVTAISLLSSKLACLPTPDVRKWSDESWCWPRWDFSVE